MIRGSFFKSVSHYFDRAASFTSLPKDILEQTMRRSYQRLSQIWRERRLPCLRDAAYLLAIEQVAQSYDRHGIFP